MSRLLHLACASLVAACAFLVGPAIASGAEAASPKPAAPDDDPFAVDPFAGPTSPDDPLGAPVKGNRRLKVPDQKPGRPKLPLKKPVAAAKPLRLTREAAAQKEPLLPGEKKLPARKERRLLLGDELWKAADARWKKLQAQKARLLAVRKKAEAQKRRVLLLKKQPAQARIEAALAAPASLDVVDTPLADVMDSLAERYKINVVLDVRALDDVGIPADTPISFRISEVSLRSALNLILRPLDLTWTICDEVLLITTPEEAEMKLVVKVYEVSDLVICRDKSGTPWADFDTLINMMKATIAPDSWDDVGGPGSVEGASFRGAEVLTIAQTDEIHREIEKLLKDLRAFTAKNREAEPPVRQKPPPAPSPRMGGLGGSGTSGFGSGGFGGGFFGVGVPERQGQD
jgi:hypothetical protein